MQRRLSPLWGVLLLMTLFRAQAQEAPSPADTTRQTPVPGDPAPGSHGRPENGAVTIFSAGAFNQGPILYSPLQLIQGRVPGLAIMRAGGGDPLQDMPVLLRGTSTLYGNAGPLYVIDGVPQASFNAVMPEDIASVEVLRSASATARYGMRGANGVIRVTTRKGSPGRPVVSYGAYGYYETVSRKGGFLTADEWRQVKREWTNGTSPGLAGIGVNLTDAGGSTDWLREIRQRKVSQLHHLSVTGGTANTHYDVAASYRHLNGALARSGNRLVNGRVALSHRALKDKLTLDGAFAVTPGRYSQYATRLPNGPFIIEEAESYNPTVPRDSAYGLIRPNPVTQLRNTSNAHHRNDWLARVGAGYRVVKGLTLAAQLSRERLHRNSSLSHRYRDSEGNHERTNEEERAESSTTLETTLQYRLAAAGHHLDALAGYANQRFRTASESRTRSFRNNFPTGWTESRFSVENAIASFFGSTSYHYQDRYFLAASLRRDQSATYGRGIRPVYFPAVNAGWRVRNEAFLRNASWLSELMLRGGYGIAGRALPVSLTLSNNLLHPDLRGEKLHETNLGVDFGVFADRLLVRVDHYRRTTHDLLTVRAIPAENGFVTVLYNEGKLQNRGWEVAVEGTPVNTPRFRWNAGFNASFNRNALQAGTDGAPGNLTRGQPVGTFYAYRFAGFTPDDRLQYLNKDGKPADWTAINQSDRVPVGNGAPNTHFGLSNGLTYGRWDLTLLLRGAAGFHILNHHRALGMQDSKGYYNLLREARSVGYNVINNSRTLYSMTDYFVEKGDFVKVDNLTLGYTLPLKSRLAQRVKVLAAAHNLATFTRFKGLDPEMAGITGVNPGVYERNPYFATRVWALGLHATL